MLVMTDDMGSGGMWTSRPHLATTTTTVENFSMGEGKFLHATRRAGSVAASPPLGDETHEDGAKRGCRHAIQDGLLEMKACLADDRETRTRRDLVLTVQAPLENSQTEWERLAPAAAEEAVENRPKTIDAQILNCDP